MKITLDICPLSINQAFQGRRFRTKGYNDFIEQMHYLLLGYGKVKIGGYVQLNYKFHLKYFKTMDADNCVKCLTDCLVKEGLIDDDRFIVKYVIEKIPSSYNWVEIEIKKRRLKI